MSDTTTTLYRTILTQRFGRAKNAFEAVMQTKVAEALKREYRDVGATMAREMRLSEAVNTSDATVASPEDVDLPMGPQDRLAAIANEIGLKGTWNAISGLSSRGAVSEVYDQIAAHLNNPAIPAFHYVPKTIDDKLKTPEIIAVELPNKTIVVSYLTANNTEKSVPFPATRDPKFQTVQLLGYLRNIPNIK